MFAWIDQHNQIVYATTRKELLQKLGYKGAVKIYQGAGMHIGYKVGDRWFTRYVISPLQGKGK